MLKHASTPTTLEWGTDSATDSTKMPLAGGTFTGDVTFTGDSSNGLWDKSASAFVANLTGNVTGNASGSSGSCTGTAAVATAITIADESSDTTCFPLFATAATGDLGAKSGSNLTFNSSSGALTATSFVGALTGDVTGNVSGSAATVTGAAQSAITSLGTLTSLGISGNLTVDTNTLHVDATNNRVGLGTTSPGWDLTLERAGTASLRIGNTADSVMVDIRATASEGFIRTASNHPLTFQVNQTERMRIDSSGRLLLGHTASIGEARAFQIVGTTADTSAAQLIRHSADSSSPGIDLTKSRNATKGSNTIVQDNDTLGQITFRGDDGTDFNSTAATIVAAVDGTPGSNDMPGRLVFSTTADGSNAETERMRLTSNGQVWIGDDASWGPNSNADNLIVGNRTSGIHHGITILSHTSSSGSLHFGDTLHDSAGVIKYDHNVGSMQFATETSTALTINSSQNATFAGTVSDSIGNLRSIPYSGNSGAYTLVAADAGKVVGGDTSWTIPASTFSAGDAVTLLNLGGSALGLTASALTYLWNTADGGNIKASTLTLGARTMATIYFTSASEAFIQASALTVS